MTSNELKELVKAHFSLVEAPVQEKFEETPRTAAEEEGYKDGMEDAIEDIKEAISDVEKTEMAEAEEEVDAVEEEAEEAKEEMMEEGEAAVDMEEVVKMIGEVVAEEMKKMSDKYEALAAKLDSMAMEPASEKTLPKASDSKVEKFNVATAKNADRMKLALNMIKNKK